LKRGNQLGWTNYNPKKVSSQNLVNIHSNNIKKVYCFELNKIFNGAYEIKNILNINESSIRNCCINKQESAGKDPITGENLGCFDTINTDNKPEINGAEKCLFDMKAQSYQTKVISHFINSVDNGLLKMLIRKQEQDFTDKEREYFDKNVLPFVNTELLFFEIANLKLKVMSGNNLTVEKVVKKIDKDKFSATSYCIFYIWNFVIKKRNKLILIHRL
jgi:ribonucleoside-diphosphate reductase alpha chain